MSSPRVCRFCRAAISGNFVSLFGKLSAARDWLCRISELLLVRVASEDGLPPQMCRKCCRRIEAHEKSQSDLSNFRKQVRESYQAPQPVRGPLKRTKVTSSDVDVTPQTAKARPPAKKHSSGKRTLDFGQSDVGRAVAETDTCSASLHIASSAELDQSDQPVLLQCADASQRPLTAQEPLLLGEVVDCSPEPPKSVLVSVTTPSRPSPWSRKLSDDEAKLGRALAGGHLPSVAKAVMAHPSLRTSIILLVLDEIESECQKLCSRNAISPFRKIPPSEVVEFQWQSLVDDLLTKAPVLCQVLFSIVSSNDHRNKRKTGSTHFPGLCMAAAVLLKERNRQMCGVQSIVSLMLFATHAEKKVYTRLNHIGTCLSYSAVLQLVGEISKLHKVPIQQWIKDDVTFKFIGDNVDKKRRVRDVRSDHQGKTLHMFSILAARSRLPPIDLPRTGQVADITSLQWHTFLPNQEEIVAVRKNLTILVSRVLVKHLKDLTPFSKCVPQHIMHQHSQEMFERSEVFVLDVLMKNEAHGPEMIDIMRTLQGYLGTDYPPSRKVASGGDQLTSERQAASQRHMLDSITPADQLHLLEPQSEDWHCLLCLLTLVWKALYCQTSRDHGTLGYFRSKLNRIPVTKDPKKDLNATLDFFLTVEKGHLVAAACKVLGVDSKSPLQLPPDLHKCTKDEQWRFVESVASQVVEKYTLIDEALTRQPIAQLDDGIHNYTKVLCHFGALVLEFLDAWAEGDGERVYRCWRLFLPHFHSSGHSKYALEALRLQFQVKALCSPHLAYHLVWDRFINTKGGSGRNIPCDLHNEHMNKLLKEVIAKMGSNLTEEALQRAARSVSTLQALCTHFDQTSGVPFVASCHSTRTDEFDVAKVAAVVTEEALLSVIPGRKHSSFPRIHTNPLWNWNTEKTKKWIEQKQKAFKAVSTRVGEGNQSDPEATDSEG